MGEDLPMDRVRTYLHDRLETGLQPVARVLHRIGVTPTQISVSGVLLNGLAGFLVIGDRLELAALVFLFGSGMDLLDGVLARTSGTASRFGAFLDSTLDRISEGVVLAAIAYRFSELGLPVDAALVVLALLGSVLVSYTRARAEGLGLKCTVGIVTRPERVVLVALGMLTGLLQEAIYLIILLTAWTVAQRVVHTHRELHTQP